MDPGKDPGFIRLLSEPGLGKMAGFSRGRSPDRSIIVTDIHCNIEINSYGDLNSFFCQFIKCFYEK